MKKLKEEIKEYIDITDNKIEEIIEKNKNNKFAKPIGIIEDQLKIIKECKEDSEQIELVQALEDMFQKNTIQQFDQNCYKILENFNRCVEENIKKWKG